MASDSAEDINVGVARSTALLLPGDLERNAQYSEYENYALMLQHSVQVDVFNLVIFFFLFISYFEYSLIPLFSFRPSSMPTLSQC